MTILSSFSLEDWQAEQIDHAFPDDDIFKQAPYYGKEGMMLGQIRRGNGCFYAVVGFVPYRYAKQIKEIISNLEKQWSFYKYRHMWE